MVYENNIFIVLMQPNGRAIGGLVRVGVVTKQVDTHFQITNAT